MISLRISSITIALAAGLCLAAGAQVAHAEEKPVEKKQAGKPVPDALVKAASDRITWPELSAEASKRIRNLSPEARRNLKSAISASLANIEAALAKVVKEDEAAKLSIGGVPASIFEVQGHDSEKRVQLRSGNGPSAEDRKRFLGLSDTAKNKLREQMAHNRERFMAMAPEERRSMMKEMFEKATQEDQGAHPQKKIQQDAQAPLPKKKIISDDSAPQAKKKILQDNPAPQPKKKIISDESVPQTKKKLSQDGQETIQKPAPEPSSSKTE